jgi:asparaginyl-tRNA synthetase
MEFCAVKEVFSEKKEKFKLRGWVHRKREHGDALFLVVRDDTGIVQCVAKKAAMPEKDFSDLSKAFVESSLEVEGTPKADERAPEGVELQLTSAKVISFGEAFPIAKDLSTEFLREKRHLWLRSQRMNAIMKVKHSMLKAFRQWFYDNEWWETTPAIITSSACEGGSTLFEMDYFGKPAYLSQSAQLYLEALIFSLRKVYALTPSFRAEKSRTMRHLAEYWHLEGEIAFAGFDDLLKVLEEQNSFVVQTLIKERREELEFLKADIASLKLVEPPFERVNYRKAVETLNSLGVQAEYGEDLDWEKEKVLTSQFEKPFFVTHFPKKIKAFYMKENPEDKDTILGADLLAPKGYGELVGGSQREDDYGKLLERLKAHDENIKLEDYDWYLDLRKYGSVPHAGWGQGMERTLRWICNLEDIQETIPFPRTASRVKP